MWLRKGNFKRETESLLIAAQNNAIRTNLIKARIDKTRQNSKCRLCGDSDETINHIINIDSKSALKSIKRDMTGWARGSIEHIFFGLKIINPKNIYKNILGISDQNRINI